MVRLGCWWRSDFETEMFEPCTFVMRFCNAGIVTTGQDLLTEVQWHIRAWICLLVGKHSSRVDYAFTGCCIDEMIDAQ